MFLFQWWDYFSSLENKLLQGAVTVQLRRFLVQLLRIWAAMHATVPARGAGDFQPQVTAMSLISPSIWQKLRYRYPQPNPSLLCYKHPKHRYIIYIYICNHMYIYIIIYIYGNGTQTYKSIGILESSSSNFSRVLSLMASHLAWWSTDSHASRCLSNKPILSCYQRFAEKANIHREVGKN